MRNQQVRIGPVLRQLPDDTVDVLKDCHDFLLEFDPADSPAVQGLLARVGAQLGYGPGDAYDDH